MMIITATIAATTTTTTAANQLTRRRQQQQQQQQQINSHSNDSSNNNNNNSKATDIMKALVTTEKVDSIKGGKEQKGIDSAYVTLRANDFQRYLWMPEVKLGVKKDVLKQDFCNKTMANFCHNMFIRTASCRRGTDNRVCHHKYFDTILKRALRKRQETGI